jgi:RND family efflux transporter MFP subunit
MNEDKLSALHIDASRKQRRGHITWVIVTGVFLLAAVAAWFAWPRASDAYRTMSGAKGKAQAERVAAATTPGAVADVTPRPPTTNTNDSVLTVSGYLVNRERIELSPRFLGVVKWVGVKKGDTVTNGQVVVLLDDAEYQARLAETEAQLDVAKVAVEKAELDLSRAQTLVANKVEMQKVLDDAMLNVKSTKAQVAQITASQKILRTYLDWCVIRSPINGVVLEKLADANELVVPQSFGGGRGPSTALIALADPEDLQVEIDLNEADLSKIRMNQKCRVSPEAFPDRHYAGYVTEIAPEANRAKGTLQLKVQVKNPDRYLTPELTARVDFLRE